MKDSFVGRVVRFLILPAMLLGSANAMAEPRRAVEPAAQSVPLPYVIRDNSGVAWNIQQDGSISDGGNELYDGGGRLMIENNQYSSQQPTAQFNEKSHELLLPPMQMGALMVSRRVAVQPQQGWCRFVELLNNPGPQAIRTTIHINFDLSGVVQQTQQVNDDKKKTPLGVAVFDGQRGLAMIGGGRGGKVPCRYQPQQNSDQVNLYYDVEIPPKQTIAVAHFQAMRPTINDAAAFVQSGKEKDLLIDLPREIRKVLVNFRPGGESLGGDINLPRTELLDIVELKSGDQYRGTLKDASFKLQTFHGLVELPATSVIGMYTVGSYRPTQVFVTLEGEMIGGTLVGDAIALQLSSGQVVNLPLAGIAKVGCRKRPGEPEEWKLDKPMAFLRDGQRIAIDLPAGPVAVSTIYGAIELRPEWLASVQFQGEDQAVHQIRLRDGSKFSGLIAGDSIELRLRGAGMAAVGSTTTPSPQTVKFPIAAIAKLQFTPPDADTADDPATLTLGNGDVLVGSTTGTIELETGFDMIKLTGTELRDLKHVEAPEGAYASPNEVTATLWDNASVSGRVRGDAIDFALQSGPALRVPVSVIEHYSQPTPDASPDMVQRIKSIVAELSNPDWKKRDRAAQQLKALGPGAANELKKLRDGQPPEGQKQIDTILKVMEKEKADAKHPPAPAGPPAQELNKDAPFIQRRG